MRHHEAFIQIDSKWASKWSFSCWHVNKTMKWTYGMFFLTTRPPWFLFTLPLFVPSSFDHLSQNPPLSWPLLTMPGSVVKPPLYVADLNLRYCLTLLLLSLTSSYEQRATEAQSTRNLSLGWWKQGCLGLVPRPDCLTGQRGVILASRRCWMPFWVDSTFFKRTIAAGLDFYSERDDLTCSLTVTFLLKGLTHSVIL